MSTITTCRCILLAGLAFCALPTIAIGQAEYGTTEGCREFQRLTTPSKDEVELRRAKNTTAAVDRKKTADEERAFSVYKEAVENAEIDCQKAAHLLESTLKGASRTTRCSATRLYRAEQKQHYSTKAKAPVNKPTTRADVLPSASHSAVGIVLPSVLHRCLVPSNDGKAECLFNPGSDGWTNDAIKAEIVRLKKGGDVHFLIDQFHMQVGDAGFFVSAAKIRQVICAVQF